MLDPVNPNIIYAGSNSGGLWRTSNGGVSWNNTTDNLGYATFGVCSIDINPFPQPNRPREILIASGSFAYSPNATYAFGIRKSTDNGNNWNSVSFSASCQSIDSRVQTVRFHPSVPGLALAVSYNSVYRSTDYGDTWSCVSIPGINPGVVLQDIEFDLANPSVIYLGSLNSGAQLWVSHNYGLAWVDRTPPAPSLSSHSRVEIDATILDPAAIYTFYVDSIFGYLVKSNDYGVTWATLSVAPVSGGLEGISRFKCEFEISDHHPNTVYVGGNYLGKSTNMGQTWSATTNYYAQFGPNSTHADIRELKQYNLAPGMDVLLIGHDGGLAISFDGANSWINLNGNGLAITQFYGGDAWEESNDFIGGAQDNSTLKGLGGTSWIRVNLGDGGTTKISSFDSKYVVGKVNAEFQYSSNYGNSFVGITSPAYDMRHNRQFSFDPKIGNRFWTGYDDLYYVDLGGGGFQLKWSSPDPSLTSDFQCLGIAPSNPNVMYLFYKQPSWTNGDISYKYFKSIDGGNTFVDMGAIINGIPGHLLGMTLPWLGVSDVVVDPLNESHVFLSFMGYQDDGSGINGSQRVLESVDGGLNWTDISTGLPPFPVNDIEYQDGTKDVLYAGTDVGVYRFDRSTNSWECFNNGLPPGIVSSIDIDNCNGKLTAFTFGRGVWQADLVESAAGQITQSITWGREEYHSFANDIRVKAGAILTIKGRVSFAQGKGLVIERGAKVVIDGGVITNNCGHTWEGIQIEGTSNLPQNISGGLASNQGILEIFNQGTLEYAHEAIRTGTFGVNGNWLWNSHGGIIRATDAKFLNNSRSVEFMSYPSYTNKSFFRRCLFETNAQLRDGQTPRAHVSMWDVRNVKFEGCDFRYDAGSTYPIGSRGYGIFTIDAKYTIKDFCPQPNVSPCPNPLKGKFENLEYGIYSVNSNRLINPKVENVVFRNNFRGAYLSGIDYASVNNCTFEVSGEPLSYGLFVDFCDYYSIQNNAFSAFASGQNIGCIVNMSGDPVNRVYRNTFSNLYSAMQAQEDNDGPATYDGLTMNCNTFTGNDYDIAVLEDITSQGDIALFQGSFVLNQPKYLVRNAYGAVCGNENQFYVDKVSLQNIVHASNANPNMLPLPQPGCSDLRVLVSNSGVVYQPSHCPNEANKPVQVINTELGQLTGIIAARQTHYDGLIDGGSTPTLLGMMNGSVPGGALKNALLAASPYLSDEVLIAYIHRGSTSPGHLKEVLSANSPLSQEVLEALEELHLPNGITSEIESVQSGISARMLLEGEIAMYQREQDLLYSDKIRYYLDDTMSVSAMDSVVYVMKTLGREDLHCRVPLAYLLKGDYQAASSELDTILSAQVESDPFCEFQRTLIQLNQAVDKCYAIQDDPTARSAVENYALECGALVCVNAQALLTQVFENRYPENVLLPQALGSRYSPESKDVRAVLKPAEGFYVYPNPSRGGFFILVESEYALENEFLLVDLTGRVVGRGSLSPGIESYFDASNLSPGTYFISRIQSGVRLQTIKIVIGE